MEVQSLIEANANAFRTLRLRALREHPEAFVASYEEEEKESLESAAKRLRASSRQDLFFGAFSDGQLVGIASFSHPQNIKIQHTGHIGEMYVVPEARGRGIGRALLNKIIDHARTIQELEDLILWVTLCNEPARNLYASAGFELVCIEPRYIKLDDRYFDVACMILRVQ
jgi:GNAT superfamily N-acetyltransferase